MSTPFIGSKSRCFSVSLKILKCLICHNDLFFQYEGVIVVEDNIFLGFLFFFHCFKLCANSHATSF